MNSPIEIFFSYAHADEDLMNDVRRQLIVYERSGRILKWHDRHIPPGSEWRSQIDEQLKMAQRIRPSVPFRHSHRTLYRLADGRIAMNVAQRSDRSNGRGRPSNCGPESHDVRRPSGAAQLPRACDK